MPTLIEEPTTIQAAGTKPKCIDEYIGRVNTKTSEVSIARMKSPAGWSEPGLGTYLHRLETKSARPT